MLGFFTALRRSQPHKQRGRRYFSPGGRLRSSNIKPEGHEAGRTNNKAHTAPTNTGATAGSNQQRIDRVISRSPKFLKRHLVALRNAPVTHISAFLILHEITAIVPLFGLAGAFHYYGWLPPFFAEGQWVVSGVEKFGRYFKRKGWIAEGEEFEAEKQARAGRDMREVEDEDNTKHSSKSKSAGRWWDRGEGGVRLVVEFATAYAVVKALLIPRLMVSFYCAPWFARLAVIPIVQGVKRVFTRTKTA